MPAESRRLAVLAYHKIGRPPEHGWDTWNYVSEETFCAQIAAVEALGFVVIDLAAFLDGLTNPESLPERCALITFDDGYASMLTVAQPCLEKMGHSAILFVPTRFVGDRNVWDAGNEPDEPICDWDQLRELQRHGISVQSHSVTHRSFNELTAADQAKEAQQSKDMLEAELGTEVSLFAFPYGERQDSDATDEAMAAAGYRAALLYKGGPLTLPADAEQPYRLGRVAVGPDTNLEKHLMGRL